ERATTAPASTPPGSYSPSRSIVVGGAVVVVGGRVVLVGNSTTSGGLPAGVATADGVTCVLIESGEVASEPSLPPLRASAITTTTKTPAAPVAYAHRGA